MRYSCPRGADVLALPHQVNCCPRTLELHPTRRQLRMSPRRLGGMPLLSSKGMRMFWTSLSSPGPFPSRRAARTAGPLHWECVRSACQGPLGALPLARFCSGRCATALRTSRGGPAAVTRTSSCADPKRDMTFAWILPRGQWPPPRPRGRSIPVPCVLGRAPPPPRGACRAPSPSPRAAAGLGGNALV